MMKLKILASALFVTVILTGCGTTKTPDYVKHLNSVAPIQLQLSDLSIDIDEKQKVPFRGDYVSGNQVGGVNILYQAGPGIGVGGLFAQMLTHGALNSGAKNNALNEKQQQANKVLQPLSVELDAFSMADLTGDMTKYNFGLDVGAHNYVLQSSPTYFLSQDGRQLTLKHLVTLKSTQSKAVLYENLIEVLAPSISTEDPMETLSTNNASVLREMSSGLYQSSLDMALADIAGQYTRDQRSQQSFKLANNGVTRYERGVLLVDSPDRKVIRNLRGWLIAFNPS